MDRAADHPSLEEGRLPMAIVLPNLGAYQRLVHVLTKEPTVAAFEFTYRAPLFKATELIRTLLPAVGSALEKFDVYFENAILDEAVRGQLIERFREEYVRRYRASEASDMFVASGEVLGFSIDLKRPDLTEDPQAARKAIEAHPHDREVLSAWVTDRTIDARHLHGDLVLFLMDVHNGRRWEEPEVQKVMTGSRTHDPVIVELSTTGALPGYFIHVLEPAIDEIDGALAWLPG